MSSVLDALRRGRGREKAQQASSAAHTDAVLRTLGYARVNQASRLKRVTRVAAALVAGVVVGMLLWTAIVWATRAYLQRASPTDGAVARDTPSQLPMPTPLTAGARGMPPPEAIGDLQRAISIDPRDARARNDLGLTYLAQGRRDEAAAQFHAAHTADPKNAESLVNLAAIDIESGRTAEARGWVTRALQLDPQSAEAHYNLAIIEEAAGNAAVAQHHYREFLQYGTDAYSSLAQDVRRRRF
jgi:tetratricopeptide (TPR) repeat protein